MLEHLDSLRDKPLHGQFLREISDKVCIKSQWMWLQKGNFTKELEGHVFAAQEQALSTNSIKAHITNYRVLLSAGFVVLMKQLII